MDRVLEAERLARSAIAECEKQCHESLEQARRERRAVLERAQQRIITLHTRAARALDVPPYKLSKPFGPNEPRHRLGSFSLTDLPDSAQPFPSQD